MYEQFAYADAGLVTTLTGTTLALKPILIDGTPEQIEMFSEALQAGKQAAFALTEADSGSDASKTKTVAVRDGDDYIINGTKCFITNAGVADIFVVFAVTDKWLLFEVSDQHVATITINRAEYMNSLPDDVCLELIDAFERCSADDNIRAVIFTGAGKNFCGGGDVKGFRGMIDRGVDLPASGMLLSAQVAYTIRNCAKPVVACVNGAAAGAGAAYVMACDFRVMTERTKLVGAFANIGFCGDSGGLYYMMRLVGAAKTMEFFMLGDIIRGAEAKNLGLCTVLAEDGKLMEESVALSCYFFLRRNSL